MDYDDLAKLSKEFAKETQEFMDEFMELHNKWMKKSPITTTIMTLHMPMNVILNLIRLFDKFPELVPEMPQMFIRMAAPFVKLKDKWGKIPNEQFIKEFGEIYLSRFDSWFENEEKKEAFKKWYEAQNKT